MQYKTDNVYIKTPKYRGWYFTEKFYLINYKIKKQLIGDNHGN